jgi:crotonobetainyl-CoA:carnitine CoA-transferase CaiB-like acyl-CoA transferase
VRRPPPACGEHTDEILSDLGYDASAIARLRKEGAV